MVLQLHQPMVRPARAGGGREEAELGSGKGRVGVTSTAKSYRLYQAKQPDAEALNQVPKHHYLPCAERRRDWETSTPMPHHSNNIVVISVHCTCWHSHFFAPAGLFPDRPQTEWHSQCYQKGSLDQLQLLHINHYLTHQEDKAACLPAPSY